MSAAELLAQPLARLLTLALAHFLWQGLALAVLLAALVELCNIRRAAARYACSLAALLTMIACPLTTLAWLGYQTGPFQPALTTAPTEFSADSSLPGAWVDSPLLATWIEAGQPYLLAAWLVGVVLFGFRLLGGALGVAHLRRGRQSLPDKLKPIVEQLGKRLHMNAMPLVFLSRQVTEAMAIGLVRPLVLIPVAWASEMPPELLEAVIAHELAHLRRRDLWVNLLQRLVETVLFYHPAVWWLSQRLRIERELCADELAVAATGNRLTYAQALEQVARQQQADIRPALAAFLRGEKDMRLLQRVQNVLRPRKDDRSRLWPAGLVALALPIGFWLASAGTGVATADDERSDPKRPAAVPARVEEELVEPAELVRRVYLDVVGQLPSPEAIHRLTAQAKWAGLASLGTDDDEDDDRPRKVVVRDGEGPRKPGPRDGDAPRKPGPRDEDEGFKPKFKNVDVGERKITAKEPNSEARRLEELTVLVKRLSAQVEKLQDEVTSLRTRSAAGARDESLRAWRETYDKQSKGEASDRDEAAAREKYFRFRGDVEKVIAEKAKAAAEQQRGVAEKAVALAREKAEQAKFKNEEVRELIERKQAEAKKAAEAAIREKLKALEREKERDIPEEELLQLKKKLRDEQALLLELELKDAKPTLKKKPTIEVKPTLKEKPLKEKPADE